MKKLSLLLIVFLLGASLHGWAQDRKYHFGLQVSPNIGWLKPEVEGIDYKGSGTVIGVSYGAVFENYFTPNVGIILGLNVMHGGGHLKYPFISTATSAGVTVPDTGMMERKYNLQYIEIPLVLKGSTGDILGKFSFYGKFGISSAFNIKAKAEDQFLSNKSLTGEKVIVPNKNVNKDVSFFREALIIGAGAEYRIGNTASAQLGITFSNGFTDILTSNASYLPASKEKARLNTVEINIGIVF